MAYPILAILYQYSYIADWFYAPASWQITIGISPLYFDPCCVCGMALLYDLPKN